MYVRSKRTAPEFRMFAAKYPIYLWGKQQVCVCAHLGGPFAGCVRVFCAGPFLLRRAAIEERELTKKCHERMNRNRHVGAATDNMMKRL